MDKSYSLIKNISIHSSKVKSIDELKDFYEKGLFSDSRMWDDFIPENEINDLGAAINSRLRNRMSQLSLGVYSVLENGPEKNIKDDDEICLFTGFGEIETTNQIIKSIVLEKFMLVSPTLFHNSVHHTSLGYYTIIKKLHNSCITISDGLDTGRSFVEYIKKRALLDKGLVVVSGEEYSSFHELDRKVCKKIIPSFIAYKIDKDQSSGFRFVSEFKDLSELKKIPLFKESENIIVARNIFLKLKDKVDKNILTEHPLVFDNPCGIIYRLSFPFAFNLKGRSMVIEEQNGKFQYFEVII